MVSQSVLPVYKNELLITKEITFLLSQLIVDNLRCRDCQGMAKKLTLLHHSWTIPEAHQGTAEPWLKNSALKF